MKLDTVTVLHVEDDSPARDLTKTCLERSDERVSVISEPSAEAGLARLEQRSIDCIVSDYEMPTTDGLEFLRDVRTEYPELPFILFTGKGSEDIAAKAINAGIDGYLQKEVGTTQYVVLAQHIETLVSKYRAERRLDYLERENHIAEKASAASARQCGRGGESASADMDLVSMAVVDAVAAREGVDPITLTPPLHEAIDTDALEALFPAESNEKNRNAESLSFTYLGYSITVTEDRKITLDK